MKKTGIILLVIAVLVAVGVWAREVSRKRYVKAFHEFQGCLQDEELGRAKKLLRRYPDLVHAESTTSVKPLHIADSPAAIQFLIENGADVNARTDAENFESTPLHWTRRKSCAEMLIRYGADINARNKIGYTPLHRAAYGGHDGVVAVLLKNGADMESIDDSGDTPLLKACSDGQTAAAKLLIEAGAKVNVRNKSGRTPFHKVVGCLVLAKGEADVRNRCLDLMDLLLASGANPRIKDSKGETPYDMATRRGLTDIPEQISAAPAEEGSEWRQIQKVYSTYPDYIRKMDRKVRRLAMRRHVREQLANLTAKDHVEAARQVCLFIKKKHLGEESKAERHAAVTVEMCMDLFFDKAGDDGAAMVIDRACDRREDLLFRASLLRLTHSGPERIRKRFPESKPQARNQLLQALRRLSCDVNEAASLRICAFRGRRSILDAVWAECVRGDAAVGMEAKYLRKLDRTQLSKGTTAKLAGIEGEIKALFSDVKATLKRTDTPDNLKRVLRFIVSTTKAQGYSYSRSAEIADILAECESD